MLPTTDVLIVGAGPTGLLLAGDLAAAGVGCTVVERRAGESALTRAFAVHARTLELLDARGIADALVGTGTRVRSLRLSGETRLFGETRLDMSVLPTRFPYVLVTPQYETERALEERALAGGAEIVRGAEAIRLRQDSAGVEVDVRGDRAAHTRRAAYLVGADGVHSMVRRSLDLPFPGESAVRSVILADVRLADPPGEALTVGSAGDAFAFIAPFGDGWYRVIAWNRRRPLPDDAPADLAEVRDIARRALGTDHGMHDPRWISRFHSDERQVPRYRVRRVFLAGDAAHVHSPAGGLGMNTGLQDAANLSWKLAAAVHGRAPDELLDTYHAERHPVGRRAMAVSGAALRAAMTGSRALRAARGPLGAAVTRLPPLARRLAGALSGLDIAYPAPRGAHPLAGRRAPDVPLAGGARLYEALRPGRFVLVAPDPAGAVPEGWDDRVRLAVLAGPSRSIVLVRPDGYVAWATADPDPALRAAALRAALAAWCGTPAADPTPHATA